MTARFKEPYLRLTGAPELRPKPAIPRRIAPVFPDLHHQRQPWLTEALASCHRLRRSFGACQRGEHPSRENDKDGNHHQELDSRDAFCPCQRAGNRMDLSIHRGHRDRPFPKAGTAPCSKTRCTAIVVRAAGYADWNGWAPRSTPRTCQVGCVPDAASSSLDSGPQDRCRGSPTRSRHCGAPPR